MSETRYDVVVIGGGITGAGIARDAIGRGLSVILLEAQEAGRRLSEAGLMLVLADPEGRIRAANAAFAIRAAGDEGEPVEGTSLVDHLAGSDDGHFRFAAEGRSGPPLCIVQVLAGDEADSPAFFLILDDVPGARFGEDESAHIHALLDSLPLGLALADTDGRFAFLNKACRNAAGLGPSERPAWPGDLVVDEDKGAVSDAVRRSRAGVTSPAHTVSMLPTKIAPTITTAILPMPVSNTLMILSLRANSPSSALVVAGLTENNLPGT